MFGGSMVAPQPRIPRTKKPVDPELPVPPKQLDLPPPTLGPPVADEARRVALGIPDDFDYRKALDDFRDKTMGPDFRGDMNPGYTLRRETLVYVEDLAKTQLEQLLEDPELSALVKEMGINTTDIKAQDAYAKLDEIETALRAAGARPPSGLREGFDDEHRRPGLRGAAARDEPVRRDAPGVPRQQDAEERQRREHEAEAAAGPGGLEGRDGRAHGPDVHGPGERGVPGRVLLLRAVDGLPAGRPRRAGGGPRPVDRAARAVPHGGRGQRGQVGGTARRPGEREGKDAGPAIRAPDHRHGQVEAPPGPALRLPLLPRGDQGAGRRR